MRPTVVLLGLLAVLVAAVPARAAKPAASWAQSEIEFVTARGLMAADARTFRPDDALTVGALTDLTAGLARRTARRPANPAVTVTMARLDSQLVTTLGLAAAAREFAEAARDAGLAPPSRFGTEVVARLLKLRKNHLADRDALERLPGDVATRAEAAYSAAQILRFSGHEIEATRRSATSFALPSLASWQRRVLETAFDLVGYPYVWGGESERATGASAPYGAQAQGGFDCSGFVWRVYKLQRYADAPRLAGTLRGRTSMAMSGEVATSARIPLERIEPGDLVFFGTRGPRSKPAEVDHMGVYTGNGWIVHSSSAGVALARLEGWYRERFAWARRPLAEAGVVPAVAPLARR